MAKETLWTIPLIYRVFFLYVEPISTIVGAFYAYVLPWTYLSLTAHVPLQTHSFSLPVHTTIEVILAQLANLYFLFTVNEAFVLRSALVTPTSLDARGRRVWNALLIGLLIADFGHLWSVRGLGNWVYRDVYKWNAMDAGNVGFVYVGAAMRLCWLSGLGLGRMPHGRVD